MEKIILSQNKHWKSAYKNLYERLVLNKITANLKTKQIQVLQGIRRSGKSSIFKLLINHLSENINPKKILYINLDDPFFVKYSHEPEKLYEIVEIAEKITQEKIEYLFLDEIQAISHWEKYIKSVYDNENFSKIFITGSNTSLLNDNLSSLLSGRYLSTHIFPPSFKELLNINGIVNFEDLFENSSKVLNIFDSMLKFGSFFEVFTQKNDDIKREILINYFDTIVFRDCISLHDIRDSKSFKELGFYLLNNMSSLYSYTSLSKAVKLNDKSIKEYISYFENCYFLYEIKQFSYSFKEQLNNKKKIYTIDNGFLSLGYNFSQNRGKLLENLIFSELQKAGKDIYFFNSNYECDFLIKEKNGEFIAIQACFELNNDNKKREVRVFDKINDYKISQKIIITSNQNDKIDDILVIPFWKYFFT
ncbi:MAG: ATP-binding protein [Campylobacteraceae bacterium]